MGNYKKFLGAVYRELKDIYFWTKVPSNSFKSNGASFHPGFIDEELCDELKELSENIFSDKQLLNVDSWINERKKESQGKVDTKVKAIFSFEKIVTNLQSL